MPELVPEASPPKPPTLVRGGSRDAGTIGDNQQLQSHFEHALVVYIQQQLAPMRAAINWLIQQQGIRNLIPDSDIKRPATHWNIGPGMGLLDGIGWGGGRGFYTSGGPVTAEAASDPFVVVPGGDQYVLSGWIDASQLTSGSASWIVRDAVSSVEIGRATQELGRAGRVEAVVEIPATTLTAEVVFRVASGIGDVIGSQPQMEMPRLAGHIGVTRPSATLYRSNEGV
jgi:hypothetical protein